MWRCVFFVVFRTTLCLQGTALVSDPSSTHDVLLLGEQVYCGAVQPDPNISANLSIICDSPTLKTHSVPGGNAEAIAKTLQEAYKDSTTIRIAAVNKKSIMAWASPAQQLEIATHISQIEKVFAQLVRQSLRLMEEERSQAIQEGRRKILAKVVALAAIQESLKVLETTTDHKRELSALEKIEKAVEDLKGDIINPGSAPKSPLRDQRGR